MIRIIIDAENHDPAVKGATVDVVGNPIEIAAELGVAIGDIYNAMKKTSPGMEKVFRQMMQSIVSDHAPTWKTELSGKPGATWFSAVVPRRKK